MPTDESDKTRKDLDFDEIEEHDETPIDQALIDVLNLEPAKSESLVDDGLVGHAEAVPLGRLEPELKPWSYENEQWTKLPNHLKHLPLFTRHIDWVSIFFRYVWAFVLKKIAFTFYLRLKVKGDYHALYQEHPRLILISNHASHLDAVAIAASIPSRYWVNLYIAAAKDYFFTNGIFTFFSKHCLGAIPIDRKGGGEAIRLITGLLQTLDRMWIILFPEGTRSKDGKIHDFKRGVSVFAERTLTPILFIYLEGNGDLWPKGAPLPSPGKLTVHVGPVKQPAPIEEVYAEYRDWVTSINPHAFDDTENPDWRAAVKPKP